MGTLSASVVNMSSMLGTFKAPDDYGEVATIGDEMEQVSAAMYTLSQKRVAVALDKAIPMMTAQLRRDVSHAMVWGSLKFDSAAAFAGVGNSLYAEAATQIRTVRHGLPKYMSPSLQASAAATLLATARMHVVFKGMAQTQEYERLRKWRDDGYNMLYRHIEIATGLRGIADTLTQAGTADIATAAAERLSEKMHALNLQKIEWEKQRQKNAMSDRESSALGALGGKFLGGVIKGMSF